MSWQPADALDRRIGDLLALEADAAERASGGTDAMRARLAPRIRRSSALDSSAVRRLIWIAVALALLLGLLIAIAALGTRHRGIPGNGSLVWASRSGVLEAADSSGRTSAIGSALHADRAVMCCSIAWSPDGDRVAVQSDAQLVVMAPNGTQRRVLLSDVSLHGPPVWSPDGSQLAVSLTEGNATHVFVVSADGGSRRRIDGNLAISNDPAWSPDGGRLAFGGDAVGDGRWALYVAPVGGPPRLVAGGFPPAWTHPPAWLLPWAPSWGAPTWSPDGQRLVFDARMAPYTFQLFVVDADGSGLRRIASDAPAPFYAHWSPDGSHIAFASWRGVSDAEDLANLWVMKADGSGAHQLADDIDPWDVVWSPDSRLLAYGRGEHGELGTPDQFFDEIWTISLDGSGATLVSRTGLTSGLGWQALFR